MAADGPLEIQSFVSKFLHLSSLGCQANLAIKFDGDNIQVNLQASIKNAYVSAEPVHTEKYSRSVKPSRIRRRNRRREAKMCKDSNLSQRVQELIFNPPTVADSLIHATAENVSSGDYVEPVETCVVDDGLSLDFDKMDNSVVSEISYSLNSEPPPNGCQSSLINDILKYVPPMHIPPIQKRAEIDRDRAADLEQFRARLDAQLSQALAPLQIDQT